MNKYKELKNKFTKEELTTLLYEKEYTYRELQLLYGYNERLFSKLAKEYNITKLYTVITKNCNKYHKINFNFDYVMHLYCNLEKSVRDIAKIYGCMHGVVSKYLKSNNIDIRSGYSSIYYQSRRKSLSRYKEVDSSGYIMLKINGEYIREHRFIMEQFLKRELSEKEYVHHIDFIKTNNDISNLFLFSSNSLHQLYHGYIEKNPYISPEQFIDHYEKKLKNTYYNSEWLYQEYIRQTRSCNDIAKELKISRQTIADKLREEGIYQLRNPTINQHL